MKLIGKGQRFLCGLEAYTSESSSIGTKFRYFQKSSQINTKEGQEEADRLDKVLQPLHNSMFIESNPSPVKYAAKLLGLCEDDVRLPLVSVTKVTKEAVKKAFVSANLI